MIWQNHAPDRTRRIGRGETRIHTKVLCRVHVNDTRVANSVLRLTKTPFVVALRALTRSGISTCKLYCSNKAAW